MSTTLDESLRPLLARGVRLQEDKARGGFVLLAPERVLAANPTVVAVLRLCDGERTVAMLIEDLARQFEADRERIGQDVAALLRELAAKRMIEL